MLAFALPTNFSVLWSQGWRTSRSPEVRNHSCLAYTRTLKALIVRRRFGNRSFSSGNMFVFLVVLYVDKEFGHMFKFRCSRAVICDNMSFTYAYLYICKYIYVYIYTYILLHLYKFIYIYFWQGELCCFLLQFAYYLGVMVCLYDIVLSHMIICIWYTNSLCKETFVAFLHVCEFFCADLRLNSVCIGRKE